MLMFWASITAWLKDFHLAQDSPFDLLKMEKMLLYWSDALIEDHLPSWKELLGKLKITILKSSSK